MKIAINALSALRGGGQTYLINLLDEFISLNIDCELTIITNMRNTHIFAKYKSKNIKVIESYFASKNLILRVLWEILYLPIFLKKNNFNSYYSPGGIMVSPMPRGCESYTALRNMLPFDDRERRRFPFFSFIRFKLWILKYVFLLSYKMANNIIFISRYSMEVVQKSLPSVKDKSKIIYHGINNNFLKEAKNNSSLPKNLTKNEYYLYVSILDVYKAQKEVVESWIEMNSRGNEFPLILVGQKYNKYGEEIVKLISESKAKNIKYIGVVDYDKLPILYKNARALIFASSCECCPNILLEKIASGRPVISSNIMPMPEFGGSSVVYFDPYEDGALERAVNYLEKDDNMKKYSDLSSLKAKCFSWRDTSKSTFEFLMNHK